MSVSECLSVREILDKIGRVISNKNMGHWHNKQLLIVCKRVHQQTSPNVVSH